MAESPDQLLEQLFDAFNRRSEAEIQSLCSEEVEFFGVTGQLAGHQRPYTGRQGLREYLADVERTWDELLVTTGEVSFRGNLVLAIGRVYARSRERGMRDLPVAWIWTLRDGRFERGRVYGDAAAALAAFEEEPAPGGSAAAETGGDEGEVLNEA
jgi:ketosteroid isomerase-like protein